MFGYYDFFPEVIHGIARFSYKLSAKKVQQVILYALYGMNQRREDFKFIDDAARLDCEVILEFGVAESLTFNYLSKEVLDISQKELSSQTLSTLDFICIIRYYVIRGERRKPLKFDYYMLRFRFYEREGELLVFHERGTQRIPTESLILFLIKIINNELSRRKMGSLPIGYLRSL